MRISRKLCRRLRRSLGNSTIDLTRIIRRVEPQAAINEVVLAGVSADAAGIITTTKGLPLALKMVKGSAVGMSQLRRRHLVIKSNEEEKLAKL